MRILLILVTALFTQSCLMVNDEKAKVVNLSAAKLDTSDREIIFLNDTGINTDMAIGLSAYGFKVKAFASQQKVTDKSDSKMELEYNEAAARYGLDIKGDYAMPCAFTKNDVWDFTITLIDIKTNEIVNAYKQRAPDGDCTTLTPIYELYPEYLNSVW